MTDTWRYTVLKHDTLPNKVQRFMSLAGIDWKHLKIVLLEADPDGDYFKWFDDAPTTKGCGNYDRLNDTVYVFECVMVSTLIHELTHYYLDCVEIDTKTAVAEYLKENDMDSLSNYGVVNYLKENWNEAYCEIVAVYGRRGQFGKVKEMLGFAKIAA